jgi:hypothetical protein
MFQAELAAIAEETKKFAGMISTRDDQDLLDSRVHKRPDRIIDHRLVVERQQVLIGNFREWIQPLGETAGQNNALQR